VGASPQLLVLLGQVSDSDLCPLDRQDLQAQPLGSWLQVAPTPAHHQSEERGSGGLGKTSVSGFITTHCFQIQKEGTGKVRPTGGRVPMGQVGQHPSPQGPGALSRGLATSSPLDFPANNRRAPSPFWVIPMPSSGQVGGAEEAWRDSASSPYLGQWVESDQERAGASPLPAYRRRRRQRQDVLPHLACSLWGPQSESRDRLRPGCPMCSGKKPHPSKGRAGPQAPPQSLGTQPVAPDHCLLDSKGVGVRRGEPVHPLHPGSPQKPNATDRRQIYIINNN
jgi:hypothetical protein